MNIFIIIILTRLLDLKYKLFYCTVQIEFKSSKKCTIYVEFVLEISLTAVKL